MQLKMQEILGFASFYDTVKSQRLSMKTAYKLTQLAKAIDGELQFYREKLQAIIQEYAVLDDNGQPVSTEDGAGVKLRPGTEAECYAAMYELQEVEVTLPDTKFHIEDFGDVELTTAEIGAVLPFIED